jgi:2-octaprenylphenol hydroxylase
MTTARALTGSVRDTDFDVIVVGAGLVGSALALGLAQQGWQVALVEGDTRASVLAEPPPARDVSDFEPRVSALSLASEALLTALGAWSGVLAGRHCRYQDMVVWDGDGTGRIHFSAGDLQAPALGTLVENRHIVRALWHGLLGCRTLTLLDGVQVAGWSSSQGLSLADGRRLTARLVVGADGAHSRLRQWAGLPTREWDYDQDAIVCTVRTVHPHRMTAWQRFSATGPLAFLPLVSEQGDDRFCSIVWSQDTDAARRLMALPDEAFQCELERAFEYTLGPVEAVSRRFAFPLRQGHAKDYVADGLALVGDAAHTIHPLAGQGANLGYGDVGVLLDELARARELGLSPADPLLLARYQRRRKGENLAMMATMEGFKQLFARDELPVRWLRNAGLRWLDRLGPLKHRLAAEAMGLGSPWIPR